MSLYHQASSTPDVTFVNLPVAAHGVIQLKRSQNASSKQLFKKCFPFLSSHPPIFNEPFGEESLSEGRHISDSSSK